MDENQFCAACGALPEDHRLPSDVQSGTIATLCAASSSKIRFPRFFVETVWKTHKDTFNDGYFHFSMVAHQTPMPVLEFTPVTDPRAPITKHGKTELYGNYAVSGRDIDDVGPDWSSAFTVLVPTRALHTEAADHFPLRFVVGIKNARSGGKKKALFLRPYKTNDELAEMAKTWSRSDWLCVELMQLLPKNQLAWLKAQSF